MKRVTLCILLLSAAWLSLAGCSGSSWSYQILQPGLEMPLAIKENHVPGMRATQDGLLALREGGEYVEAVVFTMMLDAEKACSPPTPPEERQKALLILQELKTLKRDLRDLRKFGTPMTQGLLNSLAKVFADLPPGLPLEKLLELEEAE